MKARGVLVLGAPGQLGAEVVQAFAGAGDVVVGLGHTDLDITDRGSVATAIGEAFPSIVVNTAAFHNVERCEAEPDLAFAVNAIGAWHVARAAAEVGATLVHISTDYVFDGAKGSAYLEEDRPSPLNVYGASKLAGEHLVAAACPRSFVVRVSGLYGPHPCRAKNGLNFPQLMLKLAVEKGELTVVTDEIVGPTYTPDVARQLVRLVDTSSYGIVHATGGGAVSWHGFAEETLRLAGLQSVPVHPAPAATMVRAVRRPAQSILAHGRLTALGIDVMRPWQEALRDYVRALPSNTPA